MKSEDPYLFSIYCIKLEVKIFMLAAIFLDKFVAADLPQLLQQLLFEALLMMWRMWRLVQVMKQRNMELMRLMTARYDIC